MRPASALLATSLVLAAAVAMAQLPPQAQPFAAAQEYTRYGGAWKGDFLFFIARPDAGASRPALVMAGTLRIEADGTLRGEVPEAGCSLSGSSADYVSPANASLEVNIAGCTDARFNGFYSGKLINNPVLRYASLRLAAMRTLDAGTAQVSAVIRR